MEIKFVDSHGFNTITIDESEKWNDVIGKFKNTDTYFTAGYVKPFMIHGDGYPVLFYYEGDGITAVNVVMVRCINDIEYLKLEEEKVLFDISTPYGYGGFIINGDLNESSLKKLNEDYKQFCIDNNIICEFVRCHPVLDNKEYLKTIYETRHIGNTVMMRLDSEEQIWNDITSKNRNVIRKAIKNGVTIHKGFSMELLDKFIVMYNKTMDRDNARQYYYFKKEFYEMLYNELDKEATIFYAEYDGKIISMAIILMKNKQMHYHLSASEAEFRTLAATNLLLCEAAKWGCQNGFKTFHLGGGVGGNINDTLYKFKKSFNRNSDCEFYIGSKIFDNNVYEELKNLAEKVSELDQGFFPIYRSVRN